MFHVFINLLDANEKKNRMNKNEMLESLKQKQYFHFVACIQLAFTFVKKQN